MKKKTTRFSDTMKITHIILKYFTVMNKRNYDQDVVLLLIDVYNITF